VARCCYSLAPASVGNDFDVLSFGSDFLRVAGAACHHDGVDAESSRLGSDIFTYCFASSASRRFENSTLRVLPALEEPCIDRSTTPLTSVVASRAPPNRDSGIGW
jgi:hypothetical protein